jgi:periplasmic protein CpxP/Spy
MKLTKASMAIIAAAGLLSLSPSLTAQTTSNQPPAARRGGRGMTVEDQLNRFTEQLKLTDEQKPKVKAVLEEQDKKRQELRGDTALSQEDRRTKMRAMREDLNKQMKGILTADQYKQFEALEAQRGQGRRGGQGGNQGNGGGNN